jgi:integrase
LLLAWTGQRKGDALRLTWAAYDGTHIRLKQGKRGANVRAKVAKPLKEALDAAPRTAVTILTNAAGIPWASGFDASWRKARQKSGVSGVTIHDLRGTFITLAWRSGATFREIAEISGHSESDCEAIIRKHYLAGDAAIDKIEARTNL